MLAALLLPMLTLSWFVPVDSPDPEAGQQVPQWEVLHFERDGEKQQETVRYQLFLPSFFEKGKPLPLMLFLHGAAVKISTRSSSGVPLASCQNAPISPSSSFLLSAPGVSGGTSWSSRH